MADMTSKVAAQSIAEDHSWPWRKIIVSAFVFVLISFFTYLFTPGYINPVPFKVTPYVPIPRGIPTSDILSNAKEVSTLPYHGAESIVVRDGVIYTGVAEGRILKINESGVHTFSKFGEYDCQSPAACGRPLGMRMAPDEKHLIVADAYLGLFSVSMVDGTPRKLFPLESDFRVTFFDDFDFLPNGDIILSEASVKYQLDKLLFDLLEGHPFGRLLRINPNTGDWSQVLDGLYFPNGVQLHRDNKSVLVAETTTCRVLRFPLDGGPATTFIDGLPGHPDNIRVSPRGGYWIPVSNLRHYSFSKLVDWANQYPLLRRAFAKLWMLPSFGFLSRTTSAALLRVDDDGNIVEAILDPKNNVPNVAEVVELESSRELFLTSYFLPHIGHIRF